MDSNGVAQSSSWKRKLANLFNSILFRQAFRSDFTVNRRLLRLIDRKVPPSTFGGVASSDTTVDSSSDLWIRVYNPLAFSEADRLPVIVYFHGGGFVFASADSPQIDTFCRDFAREIGAIVVSVNYRLAPEHRFPSQYDDGFRVMKAIDEGSISDDALPQNADLSRCFFAGESAGGNIAHHVTVRAAKHGFKRLKVAGLIAIQPFLGGEERTKSEIRFASGYGMTLEMTDWYWKAFLPVGSNRDHPAANVVRSGTDVSGLEFPPALVVIGGLDLLSDRIIEYCEWLKKSGKEVRVVEYPNGTHGFSWISNLPEYSMLMQDAKDFTNSYAKGVQNNSFC